MYDILLDDRPVADVILRTDLEAWTSFPRTEASRAQRWSSSPAKAANGGSVTSLVIVVGDYEFVFLDCPPSLKLLTVNALTAADSVLIPLQCEYYALEGSAS